jgi:hypothetical protein
MAITSALVNAEHAIDASDHPADTRTEGAADDASNRARCAATFVCTLRSSAFNAPDDALSVAYPRHRKKRQYGRCKCKASVRRG